MIDYLLLGDGAPGPWSFEVLDPATFALVAEGTTLVSEPSQKPPMTVAEPANLLVLAVGAWVVLLRTRIPRTRWLLLGTLVGAQSPAFAQPLTSITVTDYELQSSRRVSRTDFEYTYRVAVRNDGDTQVDNLTAEVVSNLDATRLGAVSSFTFDTLGPGAEGVAEQELTFTQDRRVLFDPATLLWSFEGDPAGAPPAAVGPLLNDTGVVNCSDGASASALCPIDSYPGQDGDTGRDVTLNSDDDGKAGFQFLKLNASGTPILNQLLDYAPGLWDCVLDEATQLTWDVLTEEATLLSSEALIAQVNAAARCGYADWRLPRRSELLSIVDYGASSPPLIDGSFFPAEASLYLTDSAVTVAESWVVDFETGRVEWRLAEESYAVPPGTGRLLMMRTPNFGVVNCAVLALVSLWWTAQVSADVEAWSDISVNGEEVRGEGPDFAIEKDGERGILFPVDHTVQLTSDAPDANKDEALWTYANREGRVRALANGPLGVPLASLPKPGEGKTPRYESHLLWKKTFVRSADTEREATFTVLPSFLELNAPLPPGVDPVQVSAAGQLPKASLILFIILHPEGQPSRLSFAQRVDLIGFTSARGGTGNLNASRLFGAYKRCGCTEWSPSSAGNRVFAADQSGSPIAGTLIGSSARSISPRFRWVNDIRSSTDCLRRLESRVMPTLALTSPIRWTCWARPAVLN